MTTKGIQDEPRTMPCFICQGIGYLELDVYSSWFQSLGTGKKLAQRCPDCKGTGVVDAPELKTESGYIPPTR